MTGRRRNTPKLCQTNPGRRWRWFDRRSGIGREALGPLAGRPCRPGGSGRECGAAGQAGGTARGAPGCVAGGRDCAGANAGRPGGGLPPWRGAQPTPAWCQDRVEQLHAPPAVPGLPSEVVQARNRRKHHTRGLRNPAGPERVPVVTARAEEATSRRAAAAVPRCPWPSAIATSIPQPSQHAPDSGITEVAVRADGRKISFRETGVLLRKSGIRLQDLGITKGGGR